MRPALALLSLVLAAPLQTAWTQTFPQGFYWGTGISGFQTEMGASAASRDTGSDWWVWATNPGNISSSIVSGDLPDTGPGFFDTYASDLFAARQLGTSAIRLSIEWSRVFPNSTASVDFTGGITAAKLAQLDALADPVAVERYRQILTTARQFGLEPFVTLNHFTLPSWLHEPIGVREAFRDVAPGSLTLPAGLQKAGWLQASAVAEFAKYAAWCAWKYGHLIDNWITVNEPSIVVGRGYLGGTHPPGILHYRAAMTATAYMVEGHARAYDVIRALDSGDANGDTIRASIGIAQGMSAFEPVDAASADDNRGLASANWYFNRMFLHAVSRGEYDANFNGLIEPAEIRSNLAGRLDFIGVNYYARTMVKGLPQPVTPLMPVLAFQSTGFYRSVLNPAGPPCPTVCSDVGWEVYPQGLAAVVGIAGSYGLPVYVAENGIATRNDMQRIGYIHQHLSALHSAISQGVADVRGYFLWSLMDNYEWNSGYAAKYGVISFDPVSRTKQARLSALYYRGVAQRNGL